jgi:hypothetical protein
MRKNFNLAQKKMQHELLTCCLLLGVDNLPSPYSIWIVGGVVVLVVWIINLVKKGNRTGNDGVSAAHRAAPPLYMQDEVQTAHLHFPDTVSGAIAELPVHGAEVHGSAGHESVGHAHSHVHAVEHTHELMHTVIDTPLAPIDFTPPMPDIPTPDVSMPDMSSFSDPGSM